MKKKELNDLIAQREKEAKKKKLFKKAYILVITLGEREMRQKNWHTTSSHDFERDGLYIHTANYAMGPNYLHVVVKGQEVVLHVNFDERALTKEKDLSSLEIKAYVPGDWEEVLGTLYKDRKKIHRAIQKEQEKKEREPRESLEPEATQQEIKRAKENFGLDI